MPINPYTQQFQTRTDAVTYLKRVVRDLFDVPGDHSGIDRLREIRKMERANLRPIDTSDKGLYVDSQIAKWMIEGAINPHRTIDRLYGLRFAYIGAVILGADDRNTDRIIAMNYNPEHIEAARKILERKGE